MSYGENHPSPIMDPSSALMREVFARFGRAFFMAHSLEKAITETLLHIGWRAHLHPPMTKEQYQQSHDAFLGSLPKPLTMGKLIERLKKLSEVPKEIKIALDDCLKARNLIAHTYFWERAGKFCFAEGQREMLAECDNYKALFERTEQQIDAFLTTYRRKIGLTDDMIFLVMNKVIDDARSSMNLSS